MKAELLKVFNSKSDVALVIGETNARAVKSGLRFGIFVPANVPAEYYEDSLNSITLTTGKVHSESGVLISCKDPSLKDAFADECARFLLPDNRAAIARDPFGWWNEVKLLFGNVLSDSNHYFVFAELLIYLHLVAKYKSEGNGTTVQWKSCGAIHDIEASDGAQHEVKSTISHSSSIVTISSKFQMAMNADNPFFLYFVRIEKDRNDGVSISSLLSIATALGCDMNQIEQILSAQGISAGSPKRQTKFFVLECKRFDAGDPQFPRLTPSSFNPECQNLLASVENFTYDINLSAVHVPTQDILADVTDVIN